MQSTLLTICCFITATLALPQLSRRAGGPTSIPKPVGCTVVNALPNDKALFASGTPGDTNGWRLSDDFNATYSLYQAYYTTSASVQDNWAQCIGQCYGYGTPGTCKSALVAYNVPIPAGYYGSKGDTISQTACLLFDEYATPLDFVQASSGQFTSETAASVYCQDSEESSAS